MNTRYKPLLAATAATLLIVLSVAATPARADQNDSALTPLFAELREEIDTSRAMAITKRIWRIWTRNDNDEVNMHMVAAARAMSTGRYRLALRQLNQVTTLAPDFSEGWNRRATVYYLAGDYDRSIADVAKTLDLEPRHFGALSGLGLIHIRLEQYDKAIKALRRALKHNPYLNSARENLRFAEQELYGKPI